MKNKLLSASEVFLPNTVRYMSLQAAIISMARQRSSLSNLSDLLTLASAF